MWQATKYRFLNRMSVYLVYIYCMVFKTTLVKNVGTLWLVTIGVRIGCAMVLHGLQTIVPTLHFNIVLQLI